MSKNNSYFSDSLSVHNLPLPSFSDKESVEAYFKSIPREGTQMSEHAGFVVMDILVQLDDGSYANVEI